MRKIATITVVFGLAAIVPASADIPPQPGDQERYLLRVIEDANHACGKVTSFKAASGGDADNYEKQGLDAFIATCANGKTYLVAVPQRRRGPPQLDPNGKPIPGPDPVVKEVSR
jgi:hypothetical protein